MKCTERIGTPQLYTNQPAIPSPKRNKKTQVNIKTFNSNTKANKKTKTLCVIFCL